MCKVRYAAHWYHVVPDHCPNFIATEVEKEWFHKTKQQVKKHYDGDPWKVDNILEKANYTLDKKVIPLWVRYHSENRHHKSLAHMWTDWYKDYFDAEFPRLMIRLEDLVFYPHETLRQVCECVDGAEYVGDSNLVLTLESSIQGGKMADNIHGKDRTGLVGAMAKHALSDRTKGMTSEDLQFAIDTLSDSETMKYFRYKLPAETDRLTN